MSPAERDVIQSVWHYMNQLWCVMPYMRETYIDGLRYQIPDETV